VGSLYQYFPNKEALLFRLQIDEWTDTWSIMDEILGDARLSALDRLRKAVLTFFRSEQQEAAFRVALDDAGVLFRDAPEARAHVAMAKQRVTLFFDELLPELPAKQRAFTADFVMTSMAAVAETITAEGRSRAEVDVWARASAHMLCGYVEALNNRAGD
jgi:AcrR family transcriptional regulator